METANPVLPERSEGALGPLVPLAAGTCLRRRYTVRDPIRFDDCSITYRGFDFKARQPVCIVEFYPSTLAMRAFVSGTVSPQSKASGALYFLSSEAFLQQHQTLMQAIGSPNIISVFDAFFENGTAYAITEQPEGLYLDEYLRLRGGPLRQEELVYIGSALSDALLIVHSLSILHCGIRADRILICTDGTVKLTGFSAAHFTVHNGHDAAYLEPSDDILSLGKTLYSAWTGRAAASPAEPPLDARMPENLSNLFRQMLSADPAMRFASVFDLRYAMNNMDLVPERPRLTAADIEAFNRMQRESEPRQNASAQCGNDFDGACAPESQIGEQKKQAERLPEPTARRLTACLCILIAALVVTLIVLLLTR